MAAWCLENNGVSSSQSSITEEPLAAPSSNACMQKFRLYETRSVIAFLSFLIFLYIYKISSFFFSPEFVAFESQFLDHCVLSFSFLCYKFNCQVSLSLARSQNELIQVVHLSHLYLHKSFFFFFLGYRMLLFILEQVLEV